MAENVEARLCGLLKNALKDETNSSHIKVCRKTKHLHQGDFFVPKGALDLDLNSESAKSARLEATIRQATSEDALPIASISSDSHSSIVFHVDRQKGYSNIIQRVLSEGERYGFQEKRQGAARVVVNPVDVQTYQGSVEESVQPALSLTQLRAVVLLKHILRLLDAHGYQAHVTKFPQADDVQDLLNALNVNIDVCQKTVIEEMSEQLALQAQTSSHREMLHSSQTERSAAEDREKRSCVVLNLRKYLTDSGLLVGKAGYHKNLNFVDVRLEDGALSDTVRKAAVIELMVSDNKEAGEAGTVCVHVASQSTAYTQQQADLLWQTCTQQPTPCLQQHHLEFGTITGRKSSVSAEMNAKEFYNVRLRQVRQAAMMKHGDHDQGAAWDDMVHSLTAASITFDLLTTTCPSQGHVDLSEEEGDNRSGPFVLYNCARLASLLLSFQQQVEEGTYPPLPGPQHINFQLLREEEEWRIALLYIHGYPRVVQETLQHWNRQQGVKADIETHKITHFLLNFSKTLSSYYSRYHILGGPEPHLLPLMFARLSLMKAAHQVMCNALQLMGLQPLAHL